MDRDVFICSSNRRRLSQRAMWYHSLDQCSGWLQWLHQSRTRSNRLTIFGSTRPLPWYIFLCALCCNSLGLSPFQFVSSMSRPSLWCCMTTCFISLSRTSNVFHTVFKIVLVASTWVSSLISLSRVFLFRSILSFFLLWQRLRKSAIGVESRWLANVDQAHRILCCTSVVSWSTKIIICPKYFVFFWKKQTTFCQNTNWWHRRVDRLGKMMLTTSRWSWLSSDASKSWRNCRTNCSRSFLSMWHNAYRCCSR